MKFPIFLMVSAGVFLGSNAALANDIYIAQTAAGANNGQDCADADSIAFFNKASDWGTGANQIGPGTVVYLCGTITTGLQINGSGTSGNVIEVLWTTGARISVAYGQIINLNGSYGYLLFDGGAACGPGTSCDSVELANTTGYAPGQAGIIEATANGSGLANQNTSTQAFYGCNGCHDIEIRNLIVRNLYQHTTTSDGTSSADTGDFTFQCPEGNSGCASGTISIHDSTVHDNGNAISLQRTNSVTFNVYHIDFYHNNWAMENSGNGTRTLNFHDNHCHDASNWDTSNDAFHHNCVHNYMNVPSDSLAINFYNNLSNGNWGSCCTTDTMLYVETDNPNNFNVFNNVCVQYAGNTAPCIQLGATTGLLANNTAIGVTPAANTEAFEVYGANLTVENNAASGYGQFIVVAPGTTFAAFNYNQWGTTEGNGNSPWQYGSTGANTFPTWKTTCACDSSGGNPSSLGVNASGVPQLGSSVIGAGANLTSLGIAALDSGTSAGGTVTPVGRPATGAWDVGAYPFSTSVAPNAPTFLSAAAI